MTDRVVATVADSYGVLVRSMAASVEEKPEAELTASDWVLRQYFLCRADICLPQCQAVRWRPAQY